MQGFHSPRRNQRSGTQQRTAISVLTQLHTRCSRMSVHVTRLPSAGIESCQRWPVRFWISIIEFVTIQRAGAVLNPMFPKRLRLMPETRMFRCTYEVAGRPPRRCTRHVPQSDLFCEPTMLVAGREAFRSGSPQVFGTRVARSRRHGAFQHAREPEPLDRTRANSDRHRTVISETS